MHTLIFLCDNKPNCIILFYQSDPGSGSVAGSSMFQAEYFYTYVKALIFCKVARPEFGAVPGSADYQFNIIRKFDVSLLGYMWSDLRKRDIIAQA